MGKLKFPCPEKSDIYSFGALLYRMITLNKPYDHIPEIKAVKQNDADAHHRVIKALRDQVYIYKYESTNNLQYP